MNLTMRVNVVVCVIAIAACGPGAAREARMIGSVERFHPSLDAIVPPDAAFELLAEGHEWTEGPLWVPALESVLYSDVLRNAIYIWREGAGASIWLRPSGYTGDVERGGESGSNGLTLDAEGRLVLAQHGDRRIARLEAPLAAPEPVFATLTERFEGRRYNSPNDLAIRSNGDVYFTDPPYGLELGVDDPARELTVHGVYRLTHDGSVTLLIDDLSRPNGVALSPDEHTLYVTNSDSLQPGIMAYDVAADGNLTRGRRFVDDWGDGMAVDRLGNVFIADGRRGVLVVAPDGTHLGTLVTGERTSNCAFGDDGSTLYVTAEWYLLRIRLETTGVGFPR